MVNGMSFLEKPIFVSGAAGCIGHAKVHAEGSGGELRPRDGIHPTTLFPAPCLRQGCN